MAMDWAIWTEDKFRLWTGKQLEKNRARLDTLERMLANQNEIVAELRRAMAVLEARESRTSPDAAPLLARHSA